jgi:hypothetical protein
MLMPSAWPSDSIARRTRPLVNGGDERAVDLELVGRDAGEGAQGRIAGAEIIDRNPHPELAQERENLHLKPALGHERILGELDHDARGEFAPLQDVDE